MSLKKNKRIVLGADPGAVPLKNMIKKHLITSGFEITDINGERTDLPFYEAAAKACHFLLEGNADLGILLCGTGAGVCIAASQFAGITAVCCESVKTARQARVINDANVMTMGAMIVNEETACAMADAFTSASFGEGLEASVRDFLKAAVKKIAELRS